MAQSRVQELFFYAVFALIVGLLTFAVVAGFFAYFGLLHAVIWSVGITIIYLLSIILQDHFNSSFTYWLHRCLAVWFGFAFIAIFFVILAGILMFLLETSSILINWLALGAAVLITIASVINAYVLTTVRILIRSKKLRQRVRIVQLSDVHLHGTGAKGRLDRILDKVIAEKPDILVITGDLLDEPGVARPESLDSLAGLKMPILFTFGNHDFYVGPATTEKMLRKSGVHVLRTKTFLFKGINFLGIDDPTAGAKFQKELSGLSWDKRRFTILLYHPPLHMKDASKAGIDLMLSGHTHSGQIYPMSILVKMLYPHYYGLRHFGNMLSYVSPGTGTWEMPMRFGSRSTIAVFDLVPSKI